MITIYALESRISGQAYIGCTKGKLGKRMREHRCLLKAGKHAEASLQAAWNKYGESGFALFALEALPDDAPVATKRERELHWMKVYDERGLLFNTNKSSFAPKPEANTKGIEAARVVNTGRRQTPEEIEKRRQAQLGKPKNNGAKISETKKRLGQRPTLEAQRKGGIAACAKRYAKD